MTTEMFLIPIRAPRRAARSDGTSSSPVLQRLHRPPEHAFFPRIHCAHQQFDEILDEMSDDLREAVLSVYSDGLRMIDVAQEMNLSATGLQYRIDAEIERVLNGKTEL